MNGLEYLHSWNIVHRDIKSGNILANINGIVKLGDFGSAKLLNETHLNTFIGTACWMAPEVIEKSGYERFADIWSLGCTVYEMLDGNSPFKDQ